MPYIPKEDRENHWLKSPGTLNFRITQLINEYLVTKGLSYTYISDCIGALECAKLELYRRVASKYEDKKLAANGEVYDKILIKG